MVPTSGGWLQAKERKRNLGSLKITSELPVGWSAASAQGKEAEAKRLPACGSAEGLANVALTQPAAILCGHLTALLPQDVLLGRGAFGRPSEALHGPA